MNLRPYQDRAISDLRASYASGRRAPCLVCPTGAGKTVIAAAIIRAAVQRGRRVLMLAHRQELITQTVAKLSASGVYDVRTIQAAADLGSRDALVAVASIPTLTGWGDRMPAADLVVFDECHHAVATTWARIADRYASAHLLGLTATPQRGDGKALGDMFDALVIGSTVRELTDLGHLVPCRVWAPSETLGQGELVLSPAQAYLQHAEGQRAVVFCSTLEHANTIAAEMNEAGIPTGVVHGNGGNAARADVLSRLASGTLRAVCNVHVLTEGWDLPVVSVCILARKPVHMGTFLQMVGRVLRPAPDKDSALLLDLCGSVHVHGTPDMDREYSLDGKGISAVKREPIRQCPSCGSVFLAPADNICPHCSMMLPARAMKMPHSIGGVLVDLATLPKLPPRAVTLSITAKFPSVCTRCPIRIAAGDQIFWTRGSKPRHVQCPAVEVAL